MHVSHATKHLQQLQEPNFKKVYFVDTLNETERKSLTRNQYEILKVVEDLSPESGRASFMNQVVRCIRSLSFVRCVGIFVWPVIQPNLPKFSTKTNEFFGLTGDEFENELMIRKNSIETNFVAWYKSLSEEEFDFQMGPFKFEGHGDGKMGINFLSGYREGRSTDAKKSSNKKIPSILTAIKTFLEEFFDPISDKSRREVFKKDRSLDIKSKDDQIINMLIDKIRSKSDAKDHRVDERNFSSMDDAYSAFQVLFGPKYLKLSRRNNDFEVLPLQRSRRTSRSVDQDSKQEKYSFRNLIADYVNKHLRKSQTGLTIRLPKLNDEIVSRKTSDALMTLGRGMKNKLTAAVPAAGMAMSFVIQLALAHAKAAASVAGMLSNMALAAAMIGMVRDMIMGTTTDNPKVKYVYDTEKYDTGISWPPNPDLTGLASSGALLGKTPFLS